MRWVSRNSRCVYIEITSDSVFNAMCENCGGVRLNANDAKRPCAARQELVICAGGEMK